MRKKGLALCLAAALAVPGAMGTMAAETEAESEAAEFETGSVKAGASLHDPMIIEGEDGVFYCYGSHMTAATSKNLRVFKSWAKEVTPHNRIFDNVVEDPYPAHTYVGKNTDGWYSVWAPSVIYNETTGQYMMYFCTTSSYIKSDLCLAVSDSAGGPYHYLDTFLYSGFTKPVLLKTNYYDIMGEDKEIRARYITAVGYNNQLWPNAIDPAAFYDGDGRMWLTYGSWSGGIFLLEIDPETGYPIHPETDDDAQVDKYFGKRLVGGYHHAIEGPYIHYDQGTGYYYLFLSYGNLQQEGGYQVRVFRSDAPDGTYTDASGRTLGIDDDLDSFADYGLKLMGNYTLPSLDCTYMAPGGQSTFEAGGNLYIVFHTRFGNKGEYHEPRVHRVVMNADGWPCVLPFAVDGDEVTASMEAASSEMAEAGTEAETAAAEADAASAEETAAAEEAGAKSAPDAFEGKVCLLNHGLDISAAVHEAEETLFEGGAISGAFEGSYELGEAAGDARYIDLTIDGQLYRGVLVKTRDEAGNEVLCLSAAGDNNESVWGVQYL